MVTAPRTLDDTISIDDEFYNLTLLNQPEEPIAADIIAVTGLAGHVRVLIYGYDSRLGGNMSRSILSNYSNNFIRILLAMRTSAECKHPPQILTGTA
ncbi:hypothetical protein N7G274_006533 [Stereocaulon virgatum]|uniref:Uncharacterized protein n=1 Tax=Stereocaulon virgatum TaxID=373712 RepID=A0ABR4A4Y7_9LECA